MNPLEPLDMKCSHPDRPQSIIPDESGQHKKFKSMSLQKIGLRMGGVSSAVFAAQGVFLLGNAFYSIMYPSSVANFEGSSLNGTPEGAVQCIGSV